MTIRRRPKAPEAPHINPDFVVGQTYEVVRADGSYGRMVGRVFTYALIRGQAYVIWMADGMNDGGYDGLSVIHSHRIKFNLVNLQLV